ncbi:PREDICTED: cyclin-dependent kinase 1-like [Drosophila arizonae]|uniref:Cyclin-dependent kinase 1-like n=1 Tax=Drosophila arizonae TaxID=7263 RepID=A0ABM1NQ03_DROAR|nr:PREDICTED: cyclin-dependent kinase 1-like [Drosophila arizonae]
MENYEIKTMIGEGTYGVVYKALNRSTGKFVALKSVKRIPGVEGLPSTTIREISLLRELKHPNIVTLLDVVIVDSSICLILEYHSMSLRQYLESLPASQLMDLKLVGSFLFQMTSAILYCHRRRVMHRDLTPQNMLIDGVGRIKLADFGLGCCFQLPVRALTHEVVTLWYRAPEILMGCPRYACPVDIWSIGCIFFEMITKRPLFRGDSEIDQLFCIFRLLGTPNEQSWPGVSTLPDYKSTFPKWKSNQLSQLMADLDIYNSAVDLLAKIIVYQPAKRLSAEQILEHEYFNDWQSGVKKNKQTKRIHGMGIIIALKPCSTVYRV